MPFSNYKTICEALKAFKATFMEVVFITETAVYNGATLHYGKLEGDRGLAEIWLLLAMN